LLHQIKPESEVSMKLTWIAALCCVLGGWLTAAADDNRAPSAEALRPIAALDVPRYMGTWYEVAKFPNWFQKKCASAARADYKLLADGSVQVTNRCRLDNGDISEAIGAARQVGASTSPKLQVRFAPAWLSFVPLVWGNYWVVDLDEAYQLAAVSEPGRDYLWVLSRTPQPNPQAYTALLARLEKQGFDLRRLTSSPLVP
jgi:apolipoprotein D and lipocalin family protein